jgi:hypothetical protein
MLLRLLPLLLVAMCVLAVVYVRLQAKAQTGARESARHAEVEARRAEVAARVREVTDLAYLHDEISPALAGAVIGRTRGLGEHSGIPELQTALDDVLDLAREHRASEPDLAVIVIDTVRRTGLA